MSTYSRDGRQTQEGVGACVLARAGAHIEPEATNCCSISRPWPAGLRSRRRQHAAASRRDSCIAALPAVERTCSAAGTHQAQGRTSSSLSSFCSNLWTHEVGLPAVTSTRMDLTQSKWQPSKLELGPQGSHSWRGPVTCHACTCIVVHACTCIIIHACTYVWATSGTSSGGAHCRIQTGHSLFGSAHSRAPLTLRVGVESGCVPPYQHLGWH